MGGTRRFEGACHCGNLQFTLHWPAGDPLPARRCQCSFCVAHGGVWTSHPQATLEIRIEDTALVPGYRFGTGTADFLVCARCGAVPAATCELDGRLRAVVNLNTAPGALAASTAVRHSDFDGESLDERLARRARNWIGGVRYT
jgi:hypothetical protein